EAAAAFTQPVALVRRAAAPERMIAVRKTSEPLDDRAVVFRTTHRTCEMLLQLRRSLREQPPIGGDGLFLHFATLGVLQRHVEEDPLHHSERRIRRRLHP